MTGRLGKFNMKAKFSSKISLNFYYLIYYSNLRKKHSSLNFEGGVGIDSKMPPPTRKKRDSAKNLHPPQKENNVLILSIIILFFVQSISLSPLMFHSLIPCNICSVHKDLVDKQKNFNSARLKSVQMTYFYFWGRAAPTSLQNHDVPNNEEQVSE